MPGIPYSPLSVDLYYPCKNARFFEAGAPTSEAALCAEMSRLAYCSKSPSAKPYDFAFDTAKINHVLSGIGFSDAVFFESKGREKNEGAHGFLTKRKTNPLAVMSFRGTDRNDPSSVLADMKAILRSWRSGGKAHAGFLDFFEKLEKEVMPAVAALECRLLITGHSLGAAMATLLASAYKPSAKHPFALYTFGSPRVGNTEFVASLTGVNTFRFVDCSDDVTLIPVFFGYEHVGHPFYIFEDRHTEFAPSLARISADQVKARSLYLIEYWSVPDKAPGRGLADHAPVNYVTAVNAAPAHPDGTPLAEKSTGAQA